MKVSIAMFILAMGWQMLGAEEVECAPFRATFNCPIEGCTLECKRPKGETLLITKINQLKMIGYQKSHTLFIADMGMGESRSVIINEGEMFCQVLNHK